MNEHETSKPYLDAVAFFEQQTEQIIKNMKSPEAIQMVKDNYDNDLFWFMQGLTYQFKKEWNTQESVSKFKGAF